MKTNWALYAWSYFWGLMVLIYLWAGFVAGGPLPKPHGFQLIHNTALGHARGDLDVT